MNKTFKKVFNARRGKYVAVDETKTGHGQMGTCTVGGHKPAALTAAVVGAVLAMGTSGALAANDVTIGQDRATVDQNYQISVSEANNLTLSGAGGSKFVKTVTYKLGIMLTKTFEGATADEAEAKYQKWRNSYTGGKYVTIKDNPNPVAVSLPGSPVQATNSTTLKVANSTKLEHDATLVNTGEITSAGGLSMALFNHLGDFGRTFQKGTSSSIEAPFRA